jgi:hypothetical protein
MPPDTVPIPVTVVAGAGRSAQRRLLAALLADRPQAARWAVLDNTAAEADRPRTVAAGVERFAVPGGCACCLAGPAFRTALVRLLRAGPWQRLLVVVDPSGHAHAIVDQFRSPPFDRLLRVSRLLVPLAATRRLGSQDDDEDRLAPATLAFASDFLLHGDDADGSALAAAVDALERADPWPRRRVAAEDRRRSTSEPRTTGADGGVGQTGVVSPDGAVPAAGWHVLSAVAPAALAGERLLVRHWPGEAVAQRRPMLDALESLRAAPEVTGLVALVRTSRAWYRWACGRVDGPVPLAIDQADFTEAETAWRLDSRLVVSLATGADRGRVAIRLESLAGLFDGA